MRMQALVVLVALVGGTAALSWSDVTHFVTEDVTALLRKLNWLSVSTTAWPDDLRGKPNLMELAEDLKLTECVKMLKHAGMNELLDHEGFYTVFCPSDEAFRRPRFYPGDVTWTDRMRLHVAKGKHNSSQFHNEEVHRTLLAKRDIRINRYTSLQHPLVTANGCPIVQFDHVARNGFLHVISEVMASVYSRNGSVISEIAKCCPQHSTLIELVSHAGMNDRLDQANPITLLAPLNRAFERIHPELLDHLKQDLPLLKKVLSGHVIPGTWYTAGLGNGDKLKTWAGDFVTVEKDASGHIRFSGAEPGMVDVTAGNGAVHSISSLLIPKSAQPQFNKMLKKIYRMDNN